MADDAAAADGADEPAEAARPSPSCVHGVPVTVVAAASGCCTRRASELRRRWSRRCTTTATSMCLDLTAVDYLDPPRPPRPARRRRRPSASRSSSP